MRRGWKWMIGWSWWSQYKYTDDHNTNRQMITIQIHKWSQYKYTNDQNTNTQMITIQVHRWSQYEYKDLRPNSSESCILSFAFNDALAWEMSYIVHILDQIMMFDLLKKDISSGRLDPLSVKKINLITQIFSDLILRMVCWRQKMCWRTDGRSEYYSTAPCCNCICVFLLAYDHFFFSYYEW